MLCAGILAAALQMPGGAQAFEPQTTTFPKMPGAPTVRIADVYLTKRDKVDFVQARKAAERRLAQATDEARADALLDYARLMISWTLLPEAASYLDQAERLDLDALQGRKLRASRAMLAVLGGNETSATTLNPVWNAALRAGRSEQLDASAIRAAMVAMVDQSPDVAAVLTTTFFEHARENGNADLARDLVEYAATNTPLEGSSQIMLMRGQLAQLEGNREVAFDFYAWAGEGNDRAAAEARLAMPILRSTVRTAKFCAA